MAESAAAENPVAPGAATEEEAASSARLPSKRPSPWRQPREIREANAAAAATDWSLPSPSKKTAKVSSISKKLKAGSSLKLSLDAVSVRIPISVTADLGVVLQRTRKKRIEALQQAFPELKEADTVENEADRHAMAEDENSKGDTTEKGEETLQEKKEGTKKKTGSHKINHVPQAREYANVLDYLEAKYVQGVMIDDAEEEMGEADEGQGSVYSETSFLDDTDLQRNVAEQVLSHTTTTKLELQDDDEFFVNVGNLEVEETELTQDQYDPLEDTKLKPAAKRKRKKPSADPNGAAENGNGSNAAAAETARASSPQKKKAKVTKTASSKQEKDKDAKKNTKAAKERLKKGETLDVLTPLKNKAKSRKAKWEKLYSAVIEMIKNSSSDQLPRRKKAVKVAVTCPANKKPGESILFANPHVPGQKLKVKIPKTTNPGGVFKVTVPVAKKPAGSDSDQNKLNREVYDALDDYARAFDDWCDAEGDYRKAIGDRDFGAHFEKRKKFDRMVEEMPKDLATPLDKPYLQKILRRARQNRHKREQTLARQAARDDDRSEKAYSEDEETRLEANAQRNKTVGTNDAFPIPQLMTEFPTRLFSLQDFK